MSLYTNVVLAYCYKDIYYAEKSKWFLRLKENGRCCEIVPEKSSLTILLLAAIKRTAYLRGLALRWGSKSGKIELPPEVTSDLFVCI